MPAFPLPALLPSHVRHRDDITNPYNMLLRLEKTILNDNNSAAKNSEKDNAERSLMYCRIVGFFFHHVPTEMGLNYIAEEVSSTGEDKQKLLGLGELYYNCVLRVFRSAKGRTPAQSSHPSRPSFDKLTDLIKTNLEEAPKSHQTAKKRALVRDGFKCLVSGAYDMITIDKFEELMAKKEMARGTSAVTQCAHIFSESTNAASDAASTWAILSRFGGRQNLLDDLNGAQVHRLENVMTLTQSVHYLFDSLRLWLEPIIGEDNKYYVNGTNPGILREFPKVVEFTTPDPIALPLPSRDYLALHAACAKVAYLSAAAEYLDFIFRDIEEMPVLSKDGSSAAVLEHAIWAAQRRPIFV